MLKKGPGIRMKYSQAQSIIQSKHGDTKENAMRQQQKNNCGNKNNCMQQTTATKKAHCMQQKATCMQQKQIACNKPEQKKQKTACNKNSLNKKNRKLHATKTACMQQKVTCMQQLRCGISYCEPPLLLLEVHLLLFLPYNKSILKEETIKHQFKHQFKTGDHNREIICTNKKEAANLTGEGKKSRITWDIFFSTLVLILRFLSSPPQL